ncbi:MAG: hypothetical protein IJS28_07380 [Synergistaceae bacterium]|nr:hypothetical protein [Synergistaceae bacterium]
MPILGPFDVGYPVDFRSGGDTTRDAFGKHIQEIKRIYGCLNALDAGKVSAEEVAGGIGSISNDLLNHINSTNPHPNWKPSWSDIRNKPNLSDLSGNLDASRITGLTSLIDGKIPEPSGDGITSGSYEENGYVKFKSGLIVEWGNHYVDTKSDNKEYVVDFPLSFPNRCLNVTLSTQVDKFSGVADAWAELIKEAISSTSFKYFLQYTTEAYNGMSNFTGNIGVSYIAMGV